MSKKKPTPIVYGLQWHVKHEDAGVSKRLYKYRPTKEDIAEYVDTYHPDKAGISVMVLEFNLPD